MQQMPTAINFHNHQQQLHQHYQRLHHPQAQPLHHYKKVALLQRSDIAQVFQDKQHLMQVPEFHPLGSYHRPSIANPLQQFQEDKVDPEANEDESTDDDDHSEEDTENEEEGNNDDEDDVDDDEEEDDEQQQQHHHHHVQPEFINPHYAFMDFHQGHFNHEMPTQAGSLPSPVGARHNTMPNFHAGNINRANQPGFLQYDQCLQSSYRICHFNGGTGWPGPTVDISTENCENIPPNLQSGGMHAYFNHKM